jgi:hypothetical protein
VLGCTTGSMVAGECMKVALVLACESVVWACRWVVLGCTTGSMVAEECMRVALVLACELVVWVCR